MADGTDESATVSRYDAILAGVPLTTLVAYVGAAALFDGPLLAQFAALAAGSAVVADGLFVHSPRDS
ncbi:hypothetical protein [Halobacterium litoreum]|uniref:Uncharacterized protein n=1 Tax=Halobacterium litoreum TaxID=2039234 RepID=A0ABD5NFE7_9EURY|nr:hypothetical protein [Halobacterium litoreum]UHH13182.1 hypothetical protein LT972_13620 [Halobacterium litoreum]